MAFFYCCGGSYYEMYLGVYMLILYSRELILDSCQEINGLWSNIYGVLDNECIVDESIKNRCILKEKASEISRAPLKLYGKPLEANAATRLRTLPSAFRNNIPRNNKRMLCPYSQLGEITIQNKCKFLKQYLKNINK